MSSTVILAGMATGLILILLALMFVDPPEILVAALGILIVVVGGFALLFATLAWLTL